MQKPDLKLIAAIIAPLLVWPFVPAWDVAYLRDGGVKALALFLLLPIVEEVVFRGFLQGWLLRLGAFRLDCSNGSNPSQPPLLRGGDSSALPLKWGSQAFRAAEARTRGSWRGFLANGFTDRLGISGANLLTSVAFALAHLWQHPAWLFPGYFAVSLVLGYFRERYDGIRVPILLHCYYNLGLWVFAG